MRGTAGGWRDCGGCFEDGAGYDRGEVVAAAEGRESAAVPSGIMRREQWQLLPIRVGRVSDGGGVRGSDTIVPRGSATRNRLAGENGKKIDWYSIHTSRRVYRA